MFRNIRSRLWLTYAILSGVVVFIIGAGLIIFLIRNPNLSRLTIERLQVIATMIQQRAELFDDVSPDRSLIALERAGEVFNSRIILYNAQRELLIDTQSDTQAPIPQLQFISSELSQADSGKVRDTEGRMWLYTVRPLQEGGLLIVTSPRPRVTLQLLFREDFATPFIQAMLIALILALILAYWMSDWVSAPLQRIANAAERISAGEYRHIPLEGPEEVKELAHSINHMVNRVKASHQSQRDLISNVSHDLKTPLTSIQGYAQAILDGTANSEDEIQTSAEIILGEAEWMSRMVADLLELARYDSGKFPLVMERLNLSDLLEEIVTIFRTIAENKSIEIITNIKQSVSTLGDRDGLMRVFSNIFENALKYSPSRGVITITSYEVNNRINIEISDTGEGIPREELPRIFERFYQVEKSRSEHEARGTGIGLSIAKEIVEAHKGKISAYNNSNQGMTFVIELPSYAPADRDG